MSNLHRDKMKSLRPLGATIYDWLPPPGRDPADSELPAGIYIFPPNAMIQCWEFRICTPEELWDDKNTGIRDDLHRLYRQLRPILDAFNKGWEFGPGWASYRGYEIKLCGKPLAVLKALASANKQSVTESELHEDVWEGYKVEGDTVRRAICDARAAIRQQLAGKIELPDNPIRAVGRGDKLAWRLLLEG